MIYNNILETIGKTPIININKISLKYNVNNDLYIKLESKNPGGSGKDRIAYKMIKSLYEENKINEHSVIVEVTSGNTGIGLAMVCAYYNLKLIVIINENVTIERIKLLEKYGAKIIKTKKEKNMEFATEIARKICKRLKNAIYIDQFSNEQNYLAHYETTANEIIEDFNNDLDYVFVGMGSTGTIMGISKKMKEIKNNIKIIGVEPKSCSYYKNNKVGKGDIPGIGTTFIPYIYNKKNVDEILLADKDDAVFFVEEVMKEEGINIGMSSGAVISSAIRYLKENNIFSKKILIICPDSIDKYLSII